MASEDGDDSRPIRSVRARPRADQIDQHIGGRIRERRVMLGLSQQELADRIGVTYHQAHKYERGINRLSVGRLHAMARVLSIEPGFFYEGLNPGEVVVPTPTQRLLLELARNFAALTSPKHQEALCNLARALADPVLQPTPDAPDSKPFDGGPSEPTPAAAPDATDAISVGLVASAGEPMGPVTMGRPSDGVSAGLVDSQPGTVDAVAASPR